MANKRIPVSSLKAGMVIGEDVHISKTILKEGKAVGKDEKAVETFDSLLQAGIVLSDKLVELIKAHVEYVVIDERSIKVSFDETVISEEVTKNVTVTGRLRITAKINPNIKLKASNRIVIEVDVPEGCVIESEVAEIVLRANVIGTEKSRVRLSSPKSISGRSFLFSDISCGDTFRASNVKDSRISAKGEIDVSGDVIKSSLNTQSGIKVNNCGSAKDKGQCELILKSANYENLCAAFSREASLTPELMKDIKLASENLEKLKDLAHKIMHSQEKIPHSQKKQLLEQLEAAEQKYIDAKSKFTAHQAKMTDTGIQLTNQLLQNKIIVSGTFYPPAIVSIENNQLNWTKMEQRVTFYIHDKDKKIKFKTSAAHF